MRLHISNIPSKLGVASRMEAVTLALGNRHSRSLPQVAETDIPCPADAVGEGLLYDKVSTCLLYLRVS